MTDELLVALVRLAAYHRGPGLFSALGTIYALSPRQAPEPARRVMVCGRRERARERWMVESDRSRRTLLACDGERWTLTDIDLAARTYRTAPTGEPLALGAPARRDTVPATVVYPVTGRAPYAELVATAASEPGRFQNVELVTSAGDRLGLWLQPTALHAPSVLAALDIPPTCRRHDDAR